ncbi:hypothetical protein BDQ12DRAFT_685651 [Crucibulum laeve]|uniref:Uncharacterized protein n=1 Tax=Crucibulum laeve TaxID=68775 RepID=A0A5C3LVQ8_9AGAR|nr:hypothetical protein BDQ12DRAFT_685651 [Crucibulum laeve]
MTSAGTYDESLLASAPAATSAQLQNGYNVDLLSPGKATPPVTRDTEAAYASKEHVHHLATPQRRTPFWRTTKGIIIMVIAALVVIGAVVGGAVGGSKKGKTASVLPDQNQTTSSSLSAGAGQQSQAQTLTQGQGGDSTAPTPSTQTVPSAPNQTPGTPASEAGSLANIPGLSTG